ncbi:hypothetical protein F0U64_15455 [Achromobacter xylosoxidans]|nr:hypothetical protein F0U64_15455 [Achromobacter xylosoxidans]
MGRCHAELSRNREGLLRSDPDPLFGLKVFNGLKPQGCQDILISMVDGLKGPAEAIGAAFPRRPALCI